MSPAEPQVDNCQDPSSLGPAVLGQKVRPGGGPGSLAVALTTASNPGSGAGPVQPPRRGQSKKAPGKRQKAVPTSGMPLEAPGHHHRPRDVGTEPQPQTQLGQARCSGALALGPSLGSSHAPQDIQTAKSPRKFFLRLLQLQRSPAEQELQGTGLAGHQPGPQPGLPGRTSTADAAAVPRTAVKAPRVVRTSGAAHASEPRPSVQWLAPGGTGGLRGGGVDGQGPRGRQLEHPKGWKPWKNVTNPPDIGTVPRLCGGSAAVVQPRSAGASAGEPGQICGNPRTSVSPGAMHTGGRQRQGMPGTLCVGGPFSAAAPAPVPAPMRAADAILVAGSAPPELGCGLSLPSKTRGPPLGSPPAKLPADQREEVPPARQNPPLGGRLVMASREAGPLGSVRLPLRMNREGEQLLGPTASQETEVLEAGQLGQMCGTEALQADSRSRVSLWH